ncbi:GRP family sugar transporter [Bifidobacterium callimiconis]|uniref:Glucose transporter GlcU n=1 Tax=Bifidobacterium callimiconis TaxID=2306973 RepID=A0A430FCE1_9BIFI|nr:GRP family sugar transporter [Bifidobacterium callimiconis]MBT1177450.1 glucose transporter GlcU [Bifidobacterium callimiconis]RSX50503.1 glucose transporter GlcU [Bifidobacterium callimiconis]
MDLVLAAMPSVVWGIYALIMPVIGGTSRHQTFGVTLGCLLFALIAFPFVPHTYTPLTVLISFLSGIFWTIGNYGQICGFKEIGVSSTMPISTGEQLVGTSLVGVLFLGDWASTQAKVLGFLAIALFIVGVAFTSYVERGDGDERANNMITGLTVITISSLGFIAYVAVIQLFSINSFDAMLPQAVGMFVGGLVIGAREPGKFSKKTLVLMLPGILWAIGNLILMISNSRLGVAISFPMSQMGLIISTIGGMVFLHESKTRKEKASISIGLVFVVVGIALVALTKTM